MKKIIADQVVVLTGASSGIGRAAVLELAKQGAKIVFGARRTQALDEVAMECRKFGAAVRGITTDVTREGDVKRLADTALRLFGRIDVWINNAAVSCLGFFERIPTEDFDRVIQTNLFGYVYGARAVIPHFKERGSGTLINVSSIVGILGQPFASPYVISKFAVRGLSEALSQELTDYKNIHICTVYPGTIDTPLFEEAANYSGKQVKPPPPVSEPEKVAEAMVKLIEHPGKFKYVGSSRLTGALKNLAPEMYDKAAHQYFEKQHFNQTTEVPPSKGNLYEPMIQFAQIHGGWK